LAEVKDGDRAMQLNWDVLRRLLRRELPDLGGGQEDLVGGCGPGRQQQTHQQKWRDQGRADEGRRYAKTAVHEGGTIHARAMDAKKRSFILVPTF
jgi:hypothetical protein